MIYKAILSFEECPGLKAYTLAKNFPLNSEVILFNFISGVLPTKSNTLSNT
jgi:hypothetical protein